MHSIWCRWRLQIIRKLQEHVTRNIPFPLSFFVTSRKMRSCHFYIAWATSKNPMYIEKKTSFSLRFCYEIFSCTLDSPLNHISVHASVLQSESKKAFLSNSRSFETKSSVILFNNSSRKRLKSCNNYPWKSKTRKGLTLTERGIVYPGLK